MNTQSLIFLKKNDKTKEELENFFGKENFYQSYELIKDDLKSMPSNNFKNKNLSVKSNFNDVQSFKIFFKPNVIKYTDRSLLLVPSKNIKNAHNFKILHIDGCKQPLYYNLKNKGWICSIRNNKLF